MRKLQLNLFPEKQIEEDYKQKLTDYLKNCKNSGALSNIFFSQFNVLKRPQANF